MERGHIAQYEYFTYSERHFDVGPGETIILPLVILIILYFLYSRTAKFIYIVCYITYIEVMDMPALTVYLTDEVYTKVKELARKEGVSISVFVRRILEHYFQEVEKE